MKVTQIYEYLNEVSGEVLGKTDLLKEDLSNIVDFGTAIYDADATDPYTKALINRIAKTVFDSKAFRFATLGIMKEAWEYGSIKRAVYSDMFETSPNQAYGLRPGASVDDNIFYGLPKIDVIMWNSEDTWSINRSITDTELKQSFTSPAELAAFWGMIEQRVKDTLIASASKLVYACYDNMIGETIWDEFGNDDPGSGSGNKAVNLLYLFNQQFNSGDGATQLLAKDAIFDKEFIRFACYTLEKWATRMSYASVLYNIMGHVNQIDPGETHLVMHADFKAAADIYLQSETFHNEFTKLPDAETVVYWQGTGTEATDFETSSKIHVITTNKKEVELGGILAVMHSDKAVAVCKEASKVTASYNAPGDFTNYYYQNKAEYTNNPYENFVVFFIADPEQD